VRHDGVPFIELSTSFLHDGRPRRQLRASLPEPFRVRTPIACADPAAAVLALLAHPNIASKAAIVRRYDHEILGATVVRPLLGAGGDGPADGVVLVDPAATDGIAIGIGVNPWYGVHDPERMAWAVVDEAMRNVVVAGGDPSAVALMDNFSWGNPTRPSTLGELVVAVRACCDAAHFFRAPFVSGKDSLNNEYLTADGTRHAIPPTLVITAVAPVRDVEAVMTPDLHQPGDVLVLLGRSLAEFGGSHLSMVTGMPTHDAGPVPSPDPLAPQRYRQLHAAIGAGLVRAAHDCSEGGLAVAVAEMAIGGRLGVRLDLAGVHSDPTVALFSESSGRIVCAVTTESVADLTSRFGSDATVIGVVTDDGQFAAGDILLSVDSLVGAFTGGGNR
jgi:phosphoribosylformylglycinamidine synthase